MRRQRRQPRQNPYRAYRGKSRWGRILSWTAGALAVLLLLLAAGAWAMFRQEWAIAGTIRRLDAPRPVYFMEIEGDYHFDAFLQQGGASSDQEVSAFLTEKISKGFYTASTTLSGTGCSVLSAQSGDGSLLWGRNFDWTGSVPIILRHVPEDGYASLSTCDFQNITGSADVLPEGVVNRMLAIAALYVPMDGVNEAGLCVADLEVNEGGMPDPDTVKPDLTVTTAIRLLLNRAATVEEALALLEQYDIHPSGGISHHLAISDAGGVSVAVEFTADGFTAVPTQAATNFNLAKGDTSAGGESARTRYETLLARLARGVISPEQVRDALSAAAQPDGAWTTQWSLVYDHAAGTASWYFGGDFDARYDFQIVQ